RAASAGVKASVIVLLGLGGRTFSGVHVRDTIRALNDMQPRYLSFLSVMLIPGTPLFEEAKRGAFEELNPKELLREMRDILDGLELEKTVFRSNHASNFLALEGRLPEDKTKMLALLDSALSGKIKLRPGFLRGL
ncbi:MAG: radical SAM protein, partial [Candidatus Omnitrophica bacterium]|nr:radical SAM protein [Candidatus Omnitrophota bacterium]